MVWPYTIVYHKFKSGMALFTDWNDIFLVMGLLDWLDSSAWRLNFLLLLKDARWKYIVSVALNLDSAVSV